MTSGDKKQGVISGSMTWKNKEYIEIFDKDYKYIYGEVEDLFIAYGAWVEYNVVDAPADHPKNCFKEARNVDMEVKFSKAPTTDEFGKKQMNVRDFNKVDFFQYHTEEGLLTHKSTIRRNFNSGNYYNNYYGEVIMSKDSRNRLIQYSINELDVMLNLIPSHNYSGSGPHWEVTHFINQGKTYSINGYLSILGLVLRGPGGIVRNKRDVIIPPDSLRLRDNRGNTQNTSETSWDESVNLTRDKEDLVGTSAGTAQNRGLGSNERSDSWERESPSREFGRPQSPQVSATVNTGFSPNTSRGSTQTFRDLPKTPTSPGLGDKSFGSFGVSSKVNLSQIHHNSQEHPVETHPAGFGRSFGKKNSEVFPSESQQPGFRASLGSFSFGSFETRNTRGLSLGSFGTPSSRSSAKLLTTPMSDGDFEIPELASEAPSFQSFEHMNGEEQKEKQNLESPVFNEDDEWGQVPEFRVRRPSSNKNVLLPPRAVKPGLSRFSNAHF